MQTKITGKVTSVFSDDVNTDDVIPAWTLQESDEREFFAQYAFEKFDTDFVKRCESEDSNIVVAGENFACGSSREQAVYALQENGVKAVIAKSYPDIFYRNSLNNGLVLITIDEIGDFEMGAEVEIDLEKKQVKVGDKTYSFEMSDEDAKTFAQGGTIGRIRTHLENILDNDEKSQEQSQSKTYDKTKPQTIVEKIVSSHVGDAVYADERVEKLPIDVLFFNEVIGPPAITYYKNDFKKVYEDKGKEMKVYDPEKIFMVPDHTVPSASVKVSEGITMMEEFSKEQGIKMYKEGDGIEHVVLIEDGYTVPGNIMLGTDSHTDTNGALNALAFGIGTTDGYFAMSTGHIYDFVVPKTIRVNLKGEFKKGVYAKDLILHLIGKLGVDGASRQVVEFGGEGLKNLSMDARTTIANMGVEMGARTAIFEPDEILEEYLKGRAQYDYQTQEADEGCEYEKTVEVDLSKLEPVVAFPHKPGNVTSITKIDDYIKHTHENASPTLARVDHVKITDAFLGACTNGRYEDFVAAAKILKGRKVHDTVSFVAIPASRKIYEQLLEEDLLEIFIKAGVNIESANCGPCFGKHMGVIGRKAQMISSSNRNYIGRMGSKEGKIFLASPATVAASAIKGEITDPREFLK